MSSYVIVLQQNGAPAPGAGAAVEILFWLGMLTAAAVAIVVVALLVRRRFMAANAAEDTPGFLLSDLRKMHAEGRLTDEEFAAAKAGLVARSRAILSDEDPAGVGGEGRPFPTDLDNDDKPDADASDTDADDVSDDGPRSDSDKR
jgi:hypothetical protein